jgi:SAM-dependent methyltransferase
MSQDPPRIGSDPRLREQVAYYRARAPEYDQWALRAGRFDRGRTVNRRWFREVRALEAALADFGPRGNVLELACGTGQWTERLSGYADRLTAVDAAPEALDINRARSHGVPVRFVLGDLLSWRAQERFDVVFFSFWLSHVPPNSFARFWAMVADALAPGGGVFVIDNARSDVAARVDPEDRGPDAFSVIRRLSDGRAYRVWKVLFTPQELEARTASLGWKLRARATGTFFQHASGVRRES